MKTITVRLNGRDYAARIKSNEAGDWRGAAARAIRRAAGRAASVWGWTLDRRDEDRSGRIVRVHWRGTVVGKPSRRDRNNYPVLGEATISMAV